MHGHVEKRVYDVMVMRAASTPKSISSSDLIDVLNQALAERWHELALLGPGVARSETVPALHTYYLKEPLGFLARLIPPLLWDEVVKRLRLLTSLTSLDLGGNWISDEDLSALTDLQGLTTLIDSSSLNAVCTCWSSRIAEKMIARSTAGSRSSHNVVVTRR
jgi:Leucine Rich Repeat (LRR) protein